jgi:hypothetical protein
MIASIALTSFVAAKRNEADDVREYFDAIFKGIAGPREAGDSAEQEIREFPADSALCAAARDDSIGFCTAPNTLCSGGRIDRS